MKLKPWKARIRRKVAKARPSITKICNSSPACASSSSERPRGLSKIAHTRLPIDEIPDEKILFYDIETDNQFAPYAKLKLIVAQVGIDGNPYVVRSESQQREFRRMLADPTMLKFGWNNKSFDDIVLARHGYPVCEENSHDLMLACKTVAPHLASYSLKFVNFHYFADPHFPEMRLERYALKKGISKWDVTGPLMDEYALWDITQTKHMFQLFWDVVIRKAHWRAYCLDVSQGEPVREMETEGGLFLDDEDLVNRIATLQNEKLYWEQRAFQLSGGRVENPNSPKQIGIYLDECGFDLELSDNGAFSVPKSLLLDLLDLDNPENDRNSVARCTYEVRKVNSSLKYYENYHEALHHCEDHLRRGWIPIQISISNARTRRYTSNSLYKLNFQNPDKEAKKVQLVPPGYLGVWIDSTQVENVVHIYESDDYLRREAYEADPEWNEYVWLCNRILGGSRTKKELDSIPSPQVPHWSIYKQFKTIKLALNFGMGIAKFCKSCGVDEETGAHMFGLVHDACPAIHRLQRRIAEDLGKFGHVADAFGHIYTGSIRQAYKVVAYLIQGCGTGSLPKAQIRANYDTLRKYDGYLRGTPDRRSPEHPRYKAGVMCGTCHDENSLRLRLSLGQDCIVAALQDLMYNMTDRFSPKFDGIPLRAKLYLSRTTCHEAEEVDIKDEKKILSFLN